MRINGCCCWSRSSDRRRNLLARGDVVRSKEEEWYYCAAGEEEEERDSLNVGSNVSEGERDKKRSQGQVLDNPFSTLTYL